MKERLEVPKLRKCRKCKKMVVMFLCDADEEEHEFCWK